MAPLLPGSVVPETMKTSFIIITDYSDKQMKGSFANLNKADTLEFNSDIELLFEIDLMLEEYLRAREEGTLEEFSFDDFDRMRKMLYKLKNDKTKRLCSFVLNISHIRNAQWKGTIECVEDGVETDFKTIPELRDFLVSVLDKKTSLQ